MATSGVTSKITSRNKILNRAARYVSAIGEAEEMTASQVVDFSEALNAMVKHWQASGIHVWSVKEATLFPQPRQFQYTVGRDAADHVTETYAETETTANIPLSAILIPVVATAAVFVADHVGIVTDAGFVHWSTVASKTPTSITLTNALPESVGVGAKVWTYTNRIARPLKIVGARRYNVASANEIPIMLEARLDYQSLPSKRDEGAITSMYYDRQRVTGIINVWQIPAIPTELLKFTWHKPLEIFTTGNDEPDFPDEWEQALAWNLADQMAGLYPVKPAMQRQIPMNAARYLDEMAGADRENESIYFGLDLE
jgi:hypothetical protein